MTSCDSMYVSKQVGIPTNSRDQNEQINIFFSLIYLWRSLFFYYVRSLIRSLYVC